jgi:hypothetical protein
MVDYRFALDTNELDDANVGLGATFVNAERFALDQSPLNDEGFGLDGDDVSFNVIAQSSQAACGGMVAQASGEVIITIVAVGNAELDGITAEASATITHGATAASNLSGLSAAATAGIDNPATGAATLGGATSTASATITHEAQASSEFGSATASASANIDNPATASASLGEIVGSGSGVISHSAQASSSFGGVISSASAGISHNAQAASSLGDISGLAQAVVVITAQGATLIPAATITANGTVIPIGEGIADAPLGSLVASASATVRKKTGSGAGGHLVQRIPPQPQIVKPEEPQEPELIEPIREPQQVFALSYARFPSVRARAIGSVVWIAEKDDEEILMLI